jgi:hypothetical protein
MAVCQFCGRQFSNAQAVRAHLKACAAYQGRHQPGGHALGSTALGSAPEAPDPAVELLEPNAEGPGHTDTAHRRAQERANRQARKETEEFLRRVAADQEARRRRALIQSVKEEVVGFGSWPHPSIPADRKAEALQEIERTLSRLPLNELPRRELVQIAQGVRDRHFRPVLEAQEASKRRARAEEQARQRARAEEDAQRRARVDTTRQSIEGATRAAAAQAEVKRGLVARGMSLVDLELRNDPDLRGRERAEIVAWVEGVLDEELTGRESTEELEDIVNDILDEEFAEDDEPDDENADDLDEDDEAEDDDPQLE